VWGRAESGGEVTLEHEHGRLPEKYVELLRQTYLLNRVHNGEEMALAMAEFERFAGRNLRGRVSIHEYRPGERFNHWIIPRRWNVRDYSITGPGGERVAGLGDHPLAVCPYSCSVDARLDRAALIEKVVSNPDRPLTYPFHFRRMYRHWEEDWNVAIPYRTASHLPEGEYHVRIEIEYTDDPMLVFEYVLEGSTDNTVFMAAHVDHPGLINDSLSGCIACLQLVEALEKQETAYGYRVWILPEIIGSAVQMKAFEPLVDNAHFAFCPNMTAHPAPLALCLSKGQNSLLDLAFRLALKESGLEHVVGAFHKYPDCGDEISFDTVGYDIPATTLSRIGEMFEQYHGSDDDLENFLQTDWQERHTAYIEVALAAFGHLEANRKVTALFRGNPCLSNPEIDLYLSSANINNQQVEEGFSRDLDGRAMDMRNFMEFFLDAISRPGVTTVEIANAANLPFGFVDDYLARFADKGLVRLDPVDRRQALDVVATTSLTTAGVLWTDMKDGNGSPP
jgi:aminopeptidase-like protein